MTIDAMFDIYMLAMRNMARAIIQHEVDLGLRPDFLMSDSTSVQNIIEDLCEHYLNEAQEKS